MKKRLSKQDNIDVLAVEMKELKLHIRKLEAERRAALAALFCLQGDQELRFTEKQMQEAMSKDLSLDRRHVTEQQAPLEPNRTVILVMVYEQR